MLCYAGEISWFLRLLLTTGGVLRQPVFQRQESLFFVGGPGRALVHYRHRSHTFIGELLHPLSFVGLGGVNVAFRICHQSVNGEELAGISATCTEVRQNLQGFAFDDENLSVGAVSEVEMNVCSGSGEKEISQTEPSPRLFGLTNNSSTNVPSFWNTCRRLFTRSQTYTRPSLEGWAQ